jgi:hypothetical protein
MAITERLEKILGEMQTLPEESKVKLMIVFSAAAMIVFISVWLVYFNSFINGQSLASNESASDTKEFSFWGSIKDETALTIQNIKGAFSEMGNRFRVGREYEISPK